MNNGLRKVSNFLVGNVSIGWANESCKANNYRTCAKKKENKS